MALKLKNRPGVKSRVNKKKVHIGANNDSIPRHPGGRKVRNDKFSITPEVLEKIAAAAGRGLNKEQICYALDISYDTLLRREKESEEIAAGVATAIKEGRSKAILTVANRLYEDAKQPRALGSQAFYLKNVSNSGLWRDNAALEVTGKDGEALIPKKEYSDDDRAIRLASLIAAVEQRAKMQQKGKKGLKLKKH